MRLDRATCAICMDSLFNKLDDLDELVPIVAPECGHIFHEECIHQWFKSQETAYIAQAREHGDYRDSSPHGSDAPAECPTCRQECFTDEAGQYGTMRLYINWGDQDDSFTAGSSPVRPTHSRKGPDERMLLARRAKALAAEAGDMSAESLPEDVRGLQRRAEGLNHDLSEQKGLDALKKLSTNLESNPLSADLRMQLAAQQHKVAEHERHLREMVERVIPASIAEATRAERKEGEKRKERLQKEADMLRQAVQEQRVLKAQLVKSHAAKMEDLEARLTAAEENAQKERKCRQSLQEDLRERTSQLRLMQAKAKSRKDLKAELEDVKAELAKLRSEHEKLSKQPSASRHNHPSSRTDTPSPFKKRRKSPEQDQPDTSGLPFHSSPRFGDSENDISIRELSPTTFSQNVKSTNHRVEQVQSSDAADESLLVDMESFDRSRGLLDPLAESPEQQLRHRARGNTTARSFTSDQFAGPSQRIAGIRSSSKYFSTATATSAQPIGSRTNPFSSTKSDTEKRKQLPKPSRVIVPASSDKEDEHHRALSPRRRVPLPTGRPQPSAKPGLKATSLRGVASASQPVAGGKKQSGGSVSIAQALGLADKNGRPMRGTATGAKAGRRA